MKHQIQQKKNKEYREKFNKIKKDVNAIYYCRIETILSAYLHKIVVIYTSKLHTHTHHVIQNLYTAMYKFEYTMKHSTNYTIFT